MHDCAGSFCYAGDNEIFSGNGDTFVRCFDIRTGQRLWEHETDGNSEQISISKDSSRVLYTDWRNAVEMDVSSRDITLELKGRHSIPKCILYGGWENSFFEQRQID